MRSCRSGLVRRRRVTGVSPVRDYRAARENRAAFPRAITDTRVQQVDRTGATGVREFRPSRRFF